MSSRFLIYSLLKEKKAPLSGERISRELGISRVAVWKQIQAMKAAGWAIEAQAKGYRLREESDLLVPWVFPFPEERIAYFPQIPSTMEEARRLEAAGCADGTLIIAEEQSRGRGRLQREWHSPRGGLYFNLVIRPGTPLARGSLYSLAAAVALAKAVRESSGLPAQVKWPNDILIGEKKVAGILLEARGEMDRLASLSIGVGVNVNTPLEDAIAGATSLGQEAGRALQRRELLIRFLSHFEAAAADLRAESAGRGMLADWRRHSATLGRRVEIVTPTGTIAGIARGVDPLGALLVEKADGAVEPVICGDCLHGSIV